MVRVTAFPWHELPAHSAQQSLARRQLRNAAHSLFDSQIAIESASNLLASELSVSVTDTDLGPAPQTSDVVLIDQTQRSFVALNVEPALAAAALSRILSRPARLQNSALPLDPALRGALAAMATEVARTSTRFSTWTAHAGIAQLPAQGLSLGCVVVLDGKRYRVTVWLAAPLAESPRRVVARDQYPKQLLLDVPLVVAKATTAVGDLLQLAPGDVWLSGNGWWIDHTLQGKGALCAPDTNLGVSVDVWADRIMLGNADSGCAMTPSNDTQQDPLAETLADLPIEVRVELGSVTLAAAEWAQLQPGDVIPFGPANSPVRLRAHGKVIAEGELVRVDDELGVRITSVLPAKTP